MNEKTFTIRLAGIDIGIQPMHAYIYEYCCKYLSDGAPDFTVAANQADLDEERRRSEDEDRCAGIQVRHYPDDYLETLAVYRKIASELLKRDILLYHGSCIAVDGVAYLFTAKSGTGKSTHVKLWQEHFGQRAVVVNDDKPLLAVTPEGVIAYGTPWDGKHRRSSNIACPLKAVCILERSKTNVIKEISAKEGYTTLLQQTYRPSDPIALALTLQVLDRLLSQVEIFRLGCNMEPEAAVISYRGMNREKQYEA